MPWNGTGFTHRYGGHSTDVVGYAYNTEEWCPSCTLLLVGSPPSARPEDLEREIRLYGETIRDLVDPEDPRWKDSTVIPQPIFSGGDAYDDDGRPRACAGCHEELVEA
jgi:hypothetical protein